MKSPWLAALVVAAIALLRMTQANSDETDKALAADSLIGKEPGQVRDDNDLKMKVVWCPPGKFIMGSPKSVASRTNDEDQVEVTLTKGFWLGKCEVSQGEWKRLMITEPWSRDKFTKEGDDFPVTFVSWEDAMYYCRLLTDHEHQAGRLSKDWEY